MAVGNPAHHQEKAAAPITLIRAITVVDNIHNNNMNKFIALTYPVARSTYP